MATITLPASNTNKFSGSVDYNLSISGNNVSITVNSVYLKTDNSKTTPTSTGDEYVYLRLWINNSSYSNATIKTEVKLPDYNNKKMSGTQHFCMGGGGVADSNTFTFSTKPTLTFTIPSNLVIYVNVGSHVTDQTINFSNGGIFGSVTKYFGPQLLQISKTSYTNVDGEAKQNITFKCSWANGTNTVSSGTISFNGSSKTVSNGGSVTFTVSTLKQAVTATLTVTDTKSTESGNKATKTLSVSALYAGPTAVSISQINYIDTEKKNYTANSFISFKCSWVNRTDTATGKVTYKYNDNATKTVTVSNGEIITISGLNRIVLGAYGTATLTVTDSKSTTSGYEVTKSITGKTFGISTFSGITRTTSSLSFRASIHYGGSVLETSGKTISVNVYDSNNNNVYSKSGLAHNSDVSVTGLSPSTKYTVKLQALGNNLSDIYYEATVTTKGVTGNINLGYVATTKTMVINSFSWTGTTGASSYTVNMFLDDRSEPNVVMLDYEYTTYKQKITIKNIKPRLADSDYLNSSHTLNVKITDNLGNTTSESYDFYTCTAPRSLSIASVTASGLNNLCIETRWTSSDWIDNIYTIDYYVYEYENNQYGDLLTQATSSNIGYNDSNELRIINGLTLDSTKSYMVLAKLTDAENNTSEAQYLYGATSEPEVPEPEEPTTKTGVYIYHNGRWVPAISYVYSNNTWN